MISIEMRRMNGALAVIAILSVLLFVGGPDAHSHRIIQYLWDSGHLVLFAAVVLVLLYTPLLHARPWGWQWLAVTLVCLGLGLAIEILQLGVGRNFEFKDLLNDVLGGYMGLALYTALNKKLALWTRLLAYPVMLVLCLIGLSPLLAVVADHFIMQEEFPVLADFETPFELSRWDTNLASVARVSDRVHVGKHAMRVRFLPGEYPDITLRDFIADWRGYKTLRFSLFNASEAPVTMELKIYDRQHQLNDYVYSDRFNRRLQLQQGWNDLVISLDQVYSAPRNRSLNREEIVSFSLFLEHLNTPMEMYFDGLYLSTKDAPPVNLD